MEYDVIIIGAGASGLMAAIAAARQGCTVLVIEQKDKAGKKILATGNGKCNFTNQNQTPECYRSDDSAFAMKVLSCFDVSKTLRFFNELGILAKERDGYYYPNSEQAVSVVSVLVMECERLKIQFRFQEKVKEIKQPNFTVITQSIPDINKKQDNYSSDTKISNNKSSNNVSSNDKSSNDKSSNDKSSNDKSSNNRSSNNRSSSDTKSEYNKTNSKIAMKVKVPDSDYDLNKAHIQTYNSKKLIIATGGCASPKLGSDGSGYQIAKCFGHSIVKPLPALVQLKSLDKFCKTISGVRVQASVGAYVNKNRIAKEVGELLFTDYGISGIPILQISRFVAKALDLGDKVTLMIDFLPEISRYDLINMLKERIRYNSVRSLEEMMIGLLNHKLSYVIINNANLDPNRSCKSISEHEVEKLAGKIKEFIMQIHDTNSFDNAQVCAGGVLTKEIEEGSMESKLVKGLYLTGELVDVDGTCGGYNLQWAWSSGYLAGTAAGGKK